MERIVKEARAPDGARIAYWTLGTGRPLVYVAGGPWSHIELWEVAQCRGWYERLARDRMLVRYDARGTGLSQRDVNDFSLAAQVSDLEAVVGELGTAEVDLFAAGDGGPVAIAYAVRHPGRVARAALWCAWARGADFEMSPRIQAWRGLIDQDWELMVETCTHLALGWDAGEIGRQAAEAFQASITREAAQAALESMVASDVTPSLAELATPTLILHRDRISWLPADIARRLASGIPDGRLAVLEGESTAPYLGDTDTLVARLEEFLAGEELGARSVAPPNHLDGPAPAGELERVFGGDPRSQRSVGVVEILPIYRTDADILVQRPSESPSWQVAFEPAAHPGDVARAALERMERVPIAVHSTSWRIDGERLILTYVAVLKDAIAEGFSAAPVRPRELARGSATDAPRSIGVEDVVEHALRHLAWLVREDKPIRAALGDGWRTRLARYKPEPFSAFDLSGSLSDEDGCLLCTRFSRPLSQFAADRSGA